EGGSVWECSSIAGDPFVPKGQGQNSSGIERLNPERLTHHSRLRLSLSNIVITEWLNDVMAASRDAALVIHARSDQCLEIGDCLWEVQPAILGECFDKRLVVTLQCSVGIRMTLARGTNLLCSPFRGRLIPLRYFLYLGETGLRTGIDLAFV